MDKWNYYNCTTPEDWRNLLIGWMRSEYYHGGLEEDLSIVEAELEEEKEREKRTNIISFMRYKARKESSKGFERE